MELFSAALQSNMERNVETNYSNDGVNLTLPKSLDENGHKLFRSRIGSGTTASKYIMLHLLLHNIAGLRSRGL